MPNSRHDFARVIGDAGEPDAPPGSGSSITNDGFSDGNYTSSPAWTAQREGSVINVVEDTQADGTTGYVLQLKDASDPRILTQDGTDVADFNVAFDIRINVSGEFASTGVVYRYQDKNNYYFLSTASAGDKINAYVVENGNSTQLISNAGLTTDCQENWVHWRVDVTGNTHELYTKNISDTSWNKDKSFTDSTISSSGNFGFGQGAGYSGHGVDCYKDELTTDPSDKL
jgi:hypothetical protein